MFIVLEGIDGVGKTTLMAGIQNALGKNALYLKTPGPNIRDVLLKGNLSNNASFFMFFSEMVDISDKFKTVVSNNKVFIDRWCLSTYIYQVIGNKHLYTTALDIFKKFLIIPDYTFILTESIDVIQERLNTREKDKFERVSVNKIKQRMTLYENADKLPIKPLLGNIVYINTHNLSVDTIVKNILREVLL